MRARSREINIFNMSLLDILCGALGAFCFMMLVLLPYYKPPGKETDLHDQELKTQDLLDELSKLRAQAQDSALAQQMAQLMEKLQEQLKQMQGQLNQMAAENDQLKTQNDKLTAKNQRQSQQIDNMRHPFLTMVASYPPQELDVYLENDGVTEKNESNPPFDPTKPHQSSFFAGDVCAWWPDHGMTVRLTRDAIPGLHYKLFIKIPQSADPAVSPAATIVKTMAISETWKLDLPDVTLSPMRFWTLVGTFSIPPDGKPTFQEATQAERDAEWRKLSKSTVPSQPQSASTAGPAMPFSVEKEQRVRSGQQAPRPSQSP
jgi:hypothetical protein